MKHLKLVVGFILTAGFTFAQTDEINLQKYWKLRNDLREDFTKIGSNPGEGLPARAIKPIDCVDNDFGYTDGTSPYESQTPKGRKGHGEIEYGDGMIRQGYYLGLLASEYRLLKDAGEDVTGTLNELYFALKAINRLDMTAEQILGPIYGLEYSDNLNGYYLREDIPEFFATNNWGSANIEARCVNSPMYKTNNAMHVNSGGYTVEANSYQNVPSLDQLSSLMMGFSLIHTLVDDVLVLPAGESEGFYIVTETKHMVDRIIHYIELHNWMMIDVNGWPVANGGGDCVFVSYPLFEAAKRITGHSYDSEANRRVNTWVIKNVQYCLTGFGIEGNGYAGQQDACLVANAIHPSAMAELSNAVPPGPDNCQGGSRYQSWLLNTIPSSTTWTPGNGGQLEDVWNNYSTYNFISWYNTTFEANSYALNLLYNIGVASGKWNQSRLNDFISGMDNKGLYLMNAVIRNETPYGQQSDYKSFLNGMTPTGPYNMKVRINGAVSMNQGPYGWSDDFRWTAGDAAFDGSDNTGIFNGIDYMLFHNLYRLAYKTNLPPINTVQECFCEATPQITLTTPPPNTTQEEFEIAKTAINLKYTFLNTCMENAFQTVSNNASGTLNLEPYFSNYISYNIFPAKFLTENAAISATGIVNAKTMFKLCNGKTLTIQNGGKLNIEKSETQIGITSTLDNYGTVTVRNGMKLKIFGKFILRGNGKLIIEDNATVIVDAASTAIIEYYNGGQIIMNGPNSKLIIRGGIKIKDAGNFNITQNGTSCGQVIIDSPNVGFTADNTNASYSFTGSGKTTTYFTITKNNKLTVFNNMAKKITFTNAKVVLEEGAGIMCYQGFYATNSSLSSAFNNGGIALSEGSNFTGTDVLNIPITSDFTSDNIGIMEAYTSTFKCNNSLVTSPYLVKVVKRGYKFQGTTFQGITDYCIYSQDLDLASSIETGTIGYNGTLPTGNLMTGIYDYSNVELAVKTSTISNCNLGINKRNGKLTLRCDNFSSNRDINVQPKDGCILNMNSTHLGGYNTLNKTTNNKNIYLWNSGYMDIQNGYNFIEGTGNTITGSVSDYCSSGCPSHNVTNNQWNTANTVPLVIGTVSTSIPGNTVPWIKSPVALKQLCPLEEIPGDKMAKSGSEKTGLPSIYSNIENDSIPLITAIYRASTYMSYYNDSTPDDLRAVQRFHEVFNSNLDKTDSTINEWLWFAKNQMKATLESAYALELITSEDNTVQFDNVTQKYVGALMYLTDSIITTDNYVQQFYHEMDKAHLLRLTGHPEIGLNILEELEYCGIDSTEQAQLNYWKSVYLGEIAIEEANVSTFDTIMSVDTSSFLNPALVINAFSFGAIIIDLNSIEYPNCDFFHTKESMHKRNAKQLSLFPNPATDNVTVQVISDVDGAGTLSIQQADGRKVLSKNVDIISKVEFDCNVTGWNPGVYLITLTFSDGKQISKRLIVK